MARSPVAALRWTGRVRIHLERRSYAVALGTGGGLDDTNRPCPGNEDAAVADVSSRMVAVLDGMGGSASGALAASIIVDALLVALRADEDRGAEVRLRDAFMLASARLTAAAAEEPALTGSGAAAIVALLDDEGATILHAGSCRAYVFRRGELAQLTRDHDLARARAEAGATAERVADESPYGRLLTTAIGAGLEAKPEATRVALAPGDRLVFVTGGIHHVVDGAALARHLGGDAERAVRALLDEVAARGTDDGGLALVDVDPL